MKLELGAVGVFICGLACAAETGEPWANPAPKSDIGSSAEVTSVVQPTKAPQPPPSSPTHSPSSAAGKVEPEPVRALTIKPVDPKSPQPNQAEIGRALALVKRGEQHYRLGQYDAAEQVLKEALAVYPFLAQANLILGKIFLIRGSATQDLSLVNSARLMFEMARALDPGLREAELLLDLFLHRPPE